MRRGVAVALALCAFTSRADAQAVPRNLLVRVQTAIEGAPLGYSVVALPALGIERFTGANGAVAVAVPTAGPQRLVVKRLGFTPKDTVIMVGDAPSQVVTVRLARVSFRLDPVRVVGWPPCRRPGLRDATREVRGIVDQLRQNAERYRLLTRTYPFLYYMEREFGRREMDGSYVAESRSVVPVSATPGWTYRPGTLVAREPGTTEWLMRIPSIGDLAEQSFVDNHCFHVAGLEEKSGAQLLRIDIVAATRLRGVDVNVAVWLDPTDFQLRHATYTLTKAPPQVRGLLYSSSTARYRELLPFVPVLELLVAENTVQQGRARTETRVLIERQTLQSVQYTGARPDSLVRDSLPAGAAAR